MNLPFAKRTAFAMLLALAATTSGCDNAVIAPGPPAPNTPNQVTPSGTWGGTETDRLGPAFLTWTLNRVGDSVSGTVFMRPMNPTDGSCGSCHKSKDGTLSGTVSGTNLALTLSFPAGGQDDPTPACSIILNGTASYVTESAITGTYHGADPCEGIFDGTLEMTRMP